MVQASIEMTTDTIYVGLGLESSEHIFHIHKYAYKMKQMQFQCIICSIYWVDKFKMCAIRATQTCDNTYERTAVPTTVRLV